MNITQKIKEIETLKAGQKEALKNEIKHHLKILEQHKKQNLSHVILSTIKDRIVFLESVLLKL